MFQVQMGNFTTVETEFSVPIYWPGCVCVCARIIICVLYPPRVAPHGHDALGLYWFSLLLLFNLFRNNNFVVTFHPFRQKEMCGICNNKSILILLINKERDSDLLLYAVLVKDNSYLRKQVQITRLTQRPFLWIWNLIIIFYPDLWRMWFTNLAVWYSAIVRRGVREFRRDMG